MVRANKVREDKIHMVTPLFTHTINWFVPSCIVPIAIGVVPGKYSLSHYILP
jgi:hypothetical protein